MLASRWQCRLPHRVGPPASRQERETGACCISNSFVHLGQHRFCHAVLQRPVAALVGVCMESCRQVMAMLAIAAVQAPHQ